VLDDFAEGAHVLVEQLRRRARKGGQRDAVSRRRVEGVGLVSQLRDRVGPVDGDGAGDGGQSIGGLNDGTTYKTRTTWGEAGGKLRSPEHWSLRSCPTIAIGHGASAATSNDDEFWSLVDHASREAGDRAWRLPMYADYRILLRSQIADLRNSEYGEAGTIMGGMFIAEFAGGKPWAHIDIAASAWNTNDELTTILRGPSGAGTRLCIELAELMAGAER